ncbi:thiamine pyrophosphate-dependent enzyme [Streptomyces tendae]|uniref:thiamine pyrophosphate-dependent enzyme n=1 Tax=Streptomyces tendae TaxID=1932 RepID=UPI0033D6C202
MTSGRAQLLRDVVRIRVVEETLADYYRDEQQMRTPTHFSIGQEATAVGVCAATTSQDLVFTAHRSHAPCLAKGGDLKAMVAELYGKQAGFDHGQDHGYPLPDRAGHRRPA